MKSFKVTMSGTDAAPVATPTEATVSDIFTTMISTTEVVTGIYGLGQRALLLIGGMALQSKRMGGPLNPFGSNG